VIPGSPNAISQLQKLGKRVFYVTNNSTKTREEFVSKCSRLGYPTTKVSQYLFALILIVQYQQNFDKIITFYFIYFSVFPPIYRVQRIRYPVHVEYLQSCYFSRIKYL
jgi:hypothetical protein